MDTVRSIVAAAFIAHIGTCSNAAAQQGAPSLDQALLLEWMVANCDREQLPALTVAVASMTINGSDAAHVAERRALISDGMKNNYPSKEAGCKSLQAGMAK